jgi:thymidylate synthase (FAD)
MSVKAINLNIPSYELADIAVVSYGNHRKHSKEEKIDLVTRMWEMGHYSPFEFQQWIFFVETPLFTARQWMRHRTGSYLEKSLRYTKLENMEGYAKKNPDGSQDDEFNAIAYGIYDIASEAYKTLLEQGYKKEDARAVLPMGIYTQFYWRIDSRNLYNFLALRLAKDAQESIRREAFNVLEEIMKHDLDLYDLYVERLRKEGVLK